MGRKRGSRFRKAIDAQHQLEEIENAQRLARKKRSGKIIERIDKSEKRCENSFKEVRNVKEARPAFTDEGG